jgi:alkylhydroperoxidase family enzyme
LGSPNPRAAWWDRQRGGAGIQQHPGIAPAPRDITVAVLPCSIDGALVGGLGGDPAGASLPARLRAIVDYAVKLTRSPHDIAESDIAGLRSVGLTDRGIHDAAAVTAYFNFVNRTASGLGVPVEE